MNVNSLIFVPSQGAPLPHLGRDFAPEKNQVCPELLVGPSRPSPNQGAPGAAGGGGWTTALAESPRSHRKDGRETDGWGRRGTGAQGEPAVRDPCLPLSERGWGGWGGLRKGVRLSPAVPQTLESESG